MSETTVPRILRWLVSVPASSGSAENLSTANSTRRYQAETNAAEKRKWKSNGNYFRAWQLRLLAIDLRDRGARFYSGQHASKVIFIA